MDAEGGHMKSMGLCSIVLCVVPGILDACTMNGRVQSPASTTIPVQTQTMPTKMRASDRMFYWIEESRELHAMATHRVREAELVLKKEYGSVPSEFVQQMRLFAHKLLEAAEYADAKAKEAELEIPPDAGQ